jgi:hypothetical protein
MAKKSKINEELPLTGRKLAKQISAKITQDINNIEPKDTKKQKKITDFLQNDAEYIKLKQKHKDFVIHFLTTKIADEAARRAGYATRQEGARLLTRASIKGIIDRYSAVEADLASDEKAKLIGKLDEIIDDLFSSNSSKINAIKTKAMLLGLNAPNKNQFLGKDGQPVDPVGPTIINKTYVQKN